MKNQFKTVLDEIIKDKKFSLDHMKYLTGQLGNRFWKSLQEILEKGVKKYIFTPSNRIVWIVIGKKKDYLIISNLYCPCNDFYVKVVIQKEVKICYHLLAKILAENLDYFDEVTVEDERYDNLMKGWRQL